MSWWPRRSRAALAAALMAILLAGASGCGYRFAAATPDAASDPERSDGAVPGGAASFSGGAPTVVADRDLGLNVSRIANPSLSTDLEYRLRSNLRDELAKRRLIRWADAGEADATLSVEIERFIDKARIKDEEDDTVKSSLELVLAATMTRKADGVVLWKSGRVKSYWLYIEDRDEAFERVIDLAVRELADRMGHAF